MNLNWLSTYQHWTFNRIIRHIFFWLITSLLYISVNYYIDSKSQDLWSSVAYEVRALPFKIACSYIIAYILVPKYLIKKRYLIFFPLACLCIAVFSCFLYLVDISSTLSQLLNINISPDFSKRLLVSKIIELFYLSAIVIGIKIFQNLIEVQRRNRALHREKTEAELKFLKSQIQPHFLFNTLNNIYGMILSDQKSKAADTLLQLSDILSYLLYDSDVERIPLQAEIKNLEDFIDIERLRYDRKLSFDYSKSDIPSNLLIAPLILLPFIENAFKHGPAKEENESFINISISVIVDVLIFKVSNSYSEGISSTPSHSGIGLENAKKRLNLLYRNKHQLEINRADSFSVSLNIELEKT